MNNLRKLLLGSLVLGLTGSSLWAGSCPVEISIGEITGSSVQYGYRVEGAELTGTFTKDSAGATRYVSAAKYTIKHLETGKRVSYDVSTDASDLTTFHGSNGNVIYTGRLHWTGTAVELESGNQPGSVSWIDANQHILMGPEPSQRRIFQSVTSGDLDYWDFHLTPSISAETVLTSGSFLKADANCDCKVDGVDFLVMQRNFGKSGAGDFNNDGIVDAADLGILSSSWGQSCN